MHRPEEKPRPDSGSVSPPPKKVRRSRLRRFLVLLLVVVIPLIAVRLALPIGLRWYVNRTIDKSPLYEGRIGDIDVHLWRGAYTINDIRLIKRNGNVPVPFFSAKQVDLAVQWKNLVHGKVVGRIMMDHPELNFVDAPDPAGSQSGVGPWLEIIRELFPFQINSTEIKEADIHFRAYQVNPPVDVYLSHINGTIDDLTNVYNEVAPMYATVNATGMAMDQANFQFKMKLDPFSYRPTFDLGVRLIGLDVQKLNQFSRAYGKFDFENGWFDLVIQVDCKEGQAQGYVKPLFRNLQIFGPRDISEDNLLEMFWEALLGVTTNVLKNAPRDQFGTVIPFTGEIGGPQPNLLAAIGNVLRNAFIRAYLPRLEPNTGVGEELHFEKGSILEPMSVGDIE